MKYTKMGHYEFLKFQMQIHILFPEKIWRTLKTMEAGTNVKQMSADCVAFLECYPLISCVTDT
jgi:hypothetical protein